jgi:hypothetical protein
MIERINRVIVIGLDGLEPTIAESMLADGTLPNMAVRTGAACFQRQLPPERRAPSAAKRRLGPDMEDLAPTILNTLGVPAPDQMKGDVLL